MSEQLVRFHVAGEAYALPLGAVREVAAGAARRALPSPPAPWVLGVASVRGELMPLVDLRRRLGHDGEAPVGAALLVVAHGGQTVAAAVDGVDGLVDAPGELAPAPAYAGEAAAAIAEIAGELIVVLRPAALLPPA